MDIEKSLEKTGVKFICGADGRLLTSFGSGGKVGYFITPKDTKTLIKALCVLSGEGVPYRVIGNGTNVLIADNGYGGALIKLSAMNGVSAAGNTVTAGAGARLSSVINTSQAHNLSGLEFADGIPAAVGGAVAMNAGAFGAEIKDKVTEITVLSGYNVRLLHNSDMCFSYRGSAVKDKNLIVLSAVFTLEDGEEKAIEARRTEFRRRRAATQPSGRSAGSVFRAAEGVSAGFYIDSVGLKGLRAGGAEISAKHANFIINRGGATTADFLTLAETAMKVVYERYGINLVKEVEIIGD